MAVQSKRNKDLNSIAELRKKAGLWLRKKREAAGLSQRELASQIGVDYYTFISQLESGRGKVPADRYEAYANALDVAPRDFAMTMLRYNDPHIYSLIFDEGESPAANSNVSALEARLRLLEAKLSD